MLYKTIVLELLEARPALYRRLRLSRSVLRELDRYAADLCSAHRQWIERGMDPVSAREWAVQELRERLAQEADRLGA